MLKPIAIGVLVSACTFARPADVPWDASASGSDAATAQLSVNGTTYGFGTGVVMMSTAPATFRITNVGTLPSGTISPATLDGAAPESFTVTTDGCSGKILDPQQSCDVLLAFSPLTVGMKEATLTIAASPGGAVVITVTGTGATSGTLAISPATPFSFNAVDAGTNATQVFTVTNMGGVSTSALMMPTVTGDSEITIMSEDCNGKVLTPTSGAQPSCTITVKFAPTVFGPRAATLSVSAVMGGTQQVSIGGNGREQFTLTVTNAGGGTVTSNPSGDITCGATCQHVYAVTSTAPTVGLMTTNAAGFTFRSWSGGCTGTGPCSVTMNANRAVTSYFQTQLSVTIASVNGGTGTVTTVPSSAFSCSTGTCSNSYDYGTMVTLHGAPNAGVNFTGWNGAGCTGTADCTIPMTTMRTVTATFSTICTPNANVAYVDRTLGTDDAQHGGAGLGCAYKTLGYAISSGSTQIQLLAADTFTLGANGEPTSYTLTGRQYLACNNAHITWGTNGTTSSEYMVTIAGSGATAGNEINSCRFDGKNRIGNAVRVTTSGPTSSLDHKVYSNTFDSIAGRGVQINANLSNILGNGNTFNNVAIGWYWADQGTIVHSITSNQFSGTSTSDLQCATASVNVQGLSNRRSGAQPSCTTCMRCGNF